MIKYYVRVSTVEQKLDRQLLAYDKADIVYSDKVSGKDKERPQLKVMLEGLQKDDVVVVKSLDRLSRSTMDLLEIAKEIEEKGATLKVLDKDIDTGTAIGKFFLTIIGAVAELERENINQRVREGVAIAKAEGKYKGRKKGSIELKGDSLNRFKMFYNKGFNKTELSKEFGVPRATIYRWEKVLKERGEL
ncbi:recombinase family protein [Cetobacterium somerae]|uniref:recombinase family protein n=1 Tax=Cetobacterium somerae TaxID=188913 RepID=UPI003891E335